MLGAKRVIGIDNVPERLALAASDGRTEVINFDDVDGAPRRGLGADARSPTQYGRIPPRARREAGAMARLQRLQSRQQDIGADAADVFDRTAAERRETGAEDHACVQQVGICDDTVVQARHRFVQHRQHGAIANFLVRHLAAFATCWREVVHIFVDTSALYALLDEADARHAEASDSLRRLVGTELVTHAYVVVETCALVGRRLPWPATERLVDGLLPVIDVRSVDSDLHAAALGAYRRAGSAARTRTLCGLWPASAQRLPPSVLR